MTSDRKETTHRRQRRHRPDIKPKKKKRRRSRVAVDPPGGQGSNDQLAPIDRFQLVFNRLYGTEYRAAKKMLHPKLQQKRMGARRGPTLYERILLFRRLRGETQGEIPGQALAVDNDTKPSYKSESRPDDTPPEERRQEFTSLQQQDSTQIRRNPNDSPQVARAQPRQQAYETKGRTSVLDRSDSSFASVDIADFASLEDEPKRSPSPQPTFTKHPRRTPTNTPSQRRSEKGTNDQVIHREISENATPRQILVELDSPRQEPRVIDDNHHTVWELEEDSRPSSQAENRKVSSRQSKREQKSVTTIIQERRHTATPRTPTPKRTPTPTRSPTPSDLNPHTVLPPIHKETTFEKSVIRSESRHSVNEEIVSKTSEEVQINKTQVKDETREMNEEICNVSSKHIKKTEDVTKDDQTVEKVDTDISRKDELIEKRNERVSNSESHEESRSSNEQNESSSDREETKDERETKSKESSFNQEERQERNSVDKNDKAIIAAASTAVAVPVLAATAVKVASSNKPKPTSELDRPNSSKAKTDNKPPKKTDEKPARSTGPAMDDNERADAIEQLDRLADHKIKKLIDPKKAGEEPHVDKNIRDKVFSKEFQDDLDNFLKSP